MNVTGKQGSEKSQSSQDNRLKLWYFGSSKGPYRNAVGDCEHETNSSTELRAQAAGYHVVDAASADLAVSGDCGHAEGCDGGDEVGEQQHRRALQHARLANHPGETEEEHDAPNVEKAPHVHTLNTAHSTAS